MTGFAADWLRLREPFDAEARDGDLARCFGAALGNEHRAARRIIDLGAGSGANFRALAPVLGGGQEWLLIDSDPQLLAAQSTEIARWSQRLGWRCRNIADGVLVETGAANWHVHTQKLDLAQSLEQVDFTACDGLTTSAFIDLVSAAWLDRLCGLLSRHAKPLLAALTVDGRRLWHPSLPDDARILEAFRRHQSGDKGFGPALGGLAAQYLADHMAAHGYEVSTAQSDWRIGARHREMLLRMAAASAAVACKMQTAADAYVAAWSEQRSAQIGCGLLTLDIGHVDLLAVPVTRS